ncbi:MAG TPA: CDP-alcohol phosphatidyltransferase family protein [Verrucomicrobiae bacterium]|nr:CDP-alcohol phosphatidyltransferase family protein [Verrucomicrobiae bacterium]
MTIPNILTILRIVLTPVIVWKICSGGTGAAFWLFLVAAATDGLDGFIARRFNCRSRLGEILDPLADKLLMVGAGVVLLRLKLLPAWLFLLIMLRELLILGGAAGYRALTGRLEIEPAVLSKANTLLLLLLILSLLGIRSGLILGGFWIEVLTLAVGASTLASGVYYVVVWGRRAARATTMPKGHNR